LFGYTSGVLGTTEGSEKAALSWDNNGGVSLFGVPHDLTSTIPGVGSSKTYTANADGIVMLYVYAETWYIQILKGGSGSVFRGKDDNSPSFGGAMLSSENAYGKVFMWPIRSGDKIQLYRHHSHTSVIATEFYFYPFGISRSNPMTVN
jgi:WD40 repeat protein